MMFGQRKIEVEILKTRKFPYTYNFLEANWCGDQFIIGCSKSKYMPNEDEEIHGHRFYLQHIMKKRFAIKKLYVYEN